MSSRGEKRFEGHRWRMRGPSTSHTGEGHPNGHTAHDRQAAPLSTKPLSLTEIRARVDKFVLDWKDETSERAEAQTFWNEFLACFGIARRRVATFEQQATRATTGNRGRIDVFWPGQLIAEQKSAGAMNDNSADLQALDYLAGGDVKPHEFPRFVISSDFQSIRLTDLEAPPGEQTLSIALTELPSHLEQFTWIAGYEARQFSTEEAEAASVKAATLMGELYVTLTGDADEGLSIDAEDEESLDASILLTRLLFLMFGDDAGLWEKGLFDEFVKTRTDEDGGDLGSQLNTLFDVLNTPEGRRSSKADPAMLAFPYVNGALFAGRQSTEFFDRDMRDALLRASAFDWTKISPAVFGSLFQAVKSKAARRADGEHYTTEENILKTLEPLFLDEIRAKVRAAWNSAKRLHEVHDSLTDLRYLDPACG